MINHILHIILHTANDTVYLIPYLYITYLILEYIEHHTHSKINAFLYQSHRFAPFYGAVLAPLSGCGLSAVAANFYVTRLISLGTLIAIYLATSDEMLPLLIAGGIPMNVIVPLLIFKIIFAAAIGFMLNYFYRSHSREPFNINSLCEHSQCGCHSHNIFISALLHTIQLLLFIFTISFLLNSAFEFLGTNFISPLLTQNRFIGLIITSFIGLIPNCAVSISLTQLYVEKIIPTDILMAGLLSNAGVGLLVFYKSSHSVRTTLKIALILFVCGIIGGNTALFLLPK